MKWLKFLWTRVVAWFRGLTASTPTPHRSLSAAATPPEEFDPCKDPFGDNLNQKVLEFNAALTAMQEAAESYMRCRLDHQQAASVSSTWVNSQIAAIQATADGIVSALSS